MSSCLVNENWFVTGWIGVLQDELFCYRMNWCVTGWIGLLQDELVCNMFKSLQDAAENAGAADTAMSMDVDSESPLSSVPMPTPM